MSSAKWSHLNRPLGYEIARLLIDAELSFSEIKEALLYTDINDNEINRILDRQVDGEDVFLIPKTRGGTKYTLNREMFSEDDVAKIHNRAQARLADNLEQNNRTGTEEEINIDEKEENPTKHIDAKNMESKFV
jgi:2-phospho-L-lactate guanylyltransferase (CobY/MobA/RfbA family)